MGHQTAVLSIKYLVTPQLNSIIEEKPSDRHIPSLAPIRVAYLVMGNGQNCTADCRIWSTPAPACASLLADDDCKR
jgi:hypothetical protein